MKYRIAVAAAGALSTTLFAQSAIYDAGTAGNPATAPDPESQGWTLVDPSAGQVTLSPLSPDPGTGLNAWMIDDQVTFNGGRAHYASLFTPAEITNAADVGWELSVEMRVISASGPDVFCEYATGTDALDDRYLLFFTLAGNDVIADVFLVGMTFTCVGGNDGNYHTYTIRKPAGASNIDAEFLYDGTVLGLVPRADSNGNAPDGGVHFGSGSSGATATVNFHAVEFGPIGGANLGMPYCMAVQNSSGVEGGISATGSRVVGVNDVTLNAFDLPVNQFGIFVTSMTQAFVPGAGGTSNGNICLGGAIGRYSAPSQILTTGSAGEFSLAIDLNQTPQAAGFVSIAAGETWNFQAWHRDPVGLGSNFTRGLEVSFQ